MDPQACFPAAHLASPGNVLSSFRSFAETAYPHMLSYSMQPHDASIFSSGAKEDKEHFSSVNHPAANRFPSMVRKNHSPDLHNGKNDIEAADLSINNKNGDGFPNANNTRLLREILQGKKTAEDILEEDREDDASDFDDESASKNGDEHLENGGDSAEIHDSVDPQKAKRARVENIVSNIRAPSDGTCISGASSENSGSTSDRKGKRKQFKPQQLDGKQPTNVEKDVMRKQLEMMQDQIEVMQERYSTLFEDKNGVVANLPNAKGGLKRQREDFPELQSDLIRMHTLSTVQAALNGAVPAEVGKLASMITAEINEQINPIIKSVINKYFPTKPAANSEDATNFPISRSPTPPRDSPERSPSKSPVRSPVRPTKVTDKQRTPLNANSDLPVRKSFVPQMCLGYPPPPVIGNENKLHFLSMAMSAPTMYGPGFQNLFRSGYFPEQTEAIPLVVQPKKKRHKVTDTRITPRGMGKMGMKEEQQIDMRKFMQSSPGPLSEMYNMNGNMAGHPFFGAPRNMRPGALNHSDSSPFYPSMQLDQARQMMMSNLYGRQTMDRDTSSPMNGSLDSPEDQNNDRNSMDFSDTEESANGGMGHQTFSQTDSTYPLSSTLTPMHLRKAKLMFFYTRYPNSATLKTYFPDIKFNKNNTAQLVKWFSNFREFYYNVMEKYAKEALSAGIKKPEDIHVEKDSEIFRVLNLHYNRNNHTDVPEPFRDVVEESLRQFFVAIQSGRSQEPSWKKAIYKVINRMDDIVPDYFKSPRFMEELE